MEDENTLYDSNDFSFSNRQIQTEQIPSLATLEFSKLQPAYLKVSIITTLIFFVIVAAIVFFFTYMGQEFFVEYAKYIWTALSVLALIIIGMVVGGFRRKSYALRERDIMYNEGLIWHTSTVIPFNRVQHCEISEGPIERMFGLSELKVFTAGGATSDMSIPGLDPKTANRLKEYIVIKTGLDEEE